MPGLLLSSDASPSRSWSLQHRYYTIIARSANHPTIRGPVERPRSMGVKAILIRRISCKSIPYEHRTVCIGRDDVGVIRRPAYHISYQKSSLDLVGE